MAAENEATCESDPNFAVICGFLEKFGVTCGLANIDFLDLQKMLENTHEVPQDLVELHIKLLRKARKSVSSERWEKALINLCHSYCSQDAWEIERFGYKKARIGSKLRILKQLLEMQFDFNSKFKNEINKMSANELRSQPLGRDKLGCAYWLQCDDSCQIRVYKDDPDEETWTLVAKNRDGIVSLISELGSGDSVNIGAEPVVNEDSSSLEIEKPMLDTGQVDSNSSKSDESDNKVEIETKLIEKPEENGEEEKEETHNSNVEEENLDVVDEIKEHLEHPQPEVEEKLEDKVGLDLSIKPTISLRIKPLNELLAPKHEEQCGVKEKYMREDKVPVQLRKAVESAGFEIHKANLKHSRDVDSPEDLQYPKKPRLMRPTLLNNKAYMPPVEPENDVEDEIEEPLMVIQGEGNGAENCSIFVKTADEIESPIVGEEIEEPIMFVCGEGSGVDCLAGNENEEKDVDSPQKATLTDARNSINELNKKTEKENSPSKIYKLGTVIDVKTDHNKITTSKCSKKLSRWDMEKVPENSANTDESETIENKKSFIQNTGQVQELVNKWEKIKSNVNIPSKNVEEEIGDQTTSKPSTNLIIDEEKIDNINPNVPEDTPKKLFFFGPSCLNFKVPSTTPSLPVTELKKDDESKISVNDVNSEHTEGDIDATKVNCDKESLSSALITEAHLRASEGTQHVSEKKGKVEEVKQVVSDCLNIGNDEQTSDKSTSLNNVTKIELHENPEKKDLSINQSEHDSRPVCNSNVEKETFQASTIQTNTSGKSEAGDNSLSKNVSSNEESFIVQNKIHEETKNENNQNNDVKDSVKGNDDVICSSLSKAESVSNQQIKGKTKNAKSSLENTDSPELTRKDYQQKNATEINKSTENVNKLENSLNYSNVDSQKNNFNKVSVTTELFEKCKTKENENLSKKNVDLENKKCLEKPTSEGNELPKKKNSKMADILLELKAKAATKDKASTSKKYDTSKLISVVKGNECKKYEKETEQMAKNNISDKSISILQIMERNEEPKDIVNILKPSNLPNEKSEIPNNSSNNSLETDEKVRSGNVNEVNHVMNLVKNKNEIASDKKHVNQKAVPDSSIQISETVKKSLPIESIDSESEKKQEVEPVELSTKINSLDLVTQIQNDGKDTEYVETENKEPGKEVLKQLDESHLKVKEENKKIELLSEDKLGRKLKNDSSKSDEKNTNNNEKELLDIKVKTEEAVIKNIIPSESLQEIQEESIKKQEDVSIIDKSSEKNNVTAKEPLNVKHTLNVTENKEPESKTTKALKPENKEQELQSEDEVTNSVDDDYDGSESNNVVEIKTYEDFEESIENVRVEQNKIQIKKQENSAEIKTYEDFEESIEVKKIKLTDAKSAKNKKEQSEEEMPVRRTRAASRRMATSAESPKKPDEPSVMKTISLEDVELSVDDTLDCEPVKQPLTLLNFQIDVDSSPPPKVTRKRGHISPVRETIPLDNAKRPKMKGKRSVDVELRRSIEDKKLQQISSSDDDFSAETPQEPKEETEKVKTAHKKGKGRKKGNKKKSAQIDSLDSDVSSKKLKEDDTTVAVKKNTPKKRTRLLLGLEIPEKYEMEIEEQGRGVRQSRRIAQLKIKEEAERRKIEELTLPDPKSEKKKKKGKNEDLDYKIEKGHKNVQVISDYDSAHDMEFDKKKKKKRRHKDIRKLFDESNPWRSSSDSSSSNDEEEEEEEIADYSDDEKLVFKSDHEFSPESDLEDNTEVQPMKRARTVRKESDVEEEVDDCNCQKCGKTDHPEWILLCDGCDNGWHCSCLRPPLFVIPEGDWYCPPCQHTTLIKNLQLQLEEFDKRLNKREVEVRRKERLAYVGISLDNVLPAKEDKKLKQKPVSDSEESESDSESSVSSETDSDEPIYQLRQRRQAHSYRFNDYDDLINSAIQEEIEAVKTSEYQNRGKDISTIVNAEKEVPNVHNEPKPEVEALPPVVPKSTELPLAAELAEKQDSDEEVIKPVKRFRYKKHRKLNSLDVSSGDDAESDEDFKGDSSDEDEDDFDDEFGSESSEGIGRNGRRYKDAPRRSTRARISRYDKDFINDDSDDAPRRKKTRSIWDESESEESDESWGRRKRKPGRIKASKTSSSPKRRKKSKKKKNSDDSDSEIYRKKKPKIKYGGLDDEDDDIGRRTRGKKITYIDALASDSDEDIGKKPHSKIEESEEEFVLNEEEDDDKESEEIEDDDSREEDQEALKKIKHMEDLKNTLADASAALSADMNLLPLVSSDNNLMKTSNITDEFDEPNPIEEINKNVEEMDEKEMEMMIEDEEYANKQLQLVAVQIEKERKRKEREAQKQVNIEPKIPKKRGRKPKALLALQELPVTTPLNLPSESLPEISLNKSVIEDTPKKRRGRGKGKKTLAAEAAAAATKDGPPTSSYENSSNSSILDSPSQSGKLRIATPPQPFSQSQPTPSVITRMLQNQPEQQGYPLPNVGTKFFTATGESRSNVQHNESIPTATLAATPATSQTPTSGQFIPGPRGLTTQYRPPGPNLNYPIARGGPAQPPAIPQNVQAISHIFHSHHPMDPSPSGGGPISLPGRSSPSAVPPTSSSPLSNKSSATPPPPPPYVRPQMIRYPPTSNIPPMTNPSALPPRPMMMSHLQQPRGRLSPYQSNMPPNYHYPPFQQNLNEDRASGSPSYANSYEQFPAEGPHEGKLYDDDSEGEFGGLVSYFSSQREDDLDT